LLHCLRAPLRIAPQPLLRSVRRIMRFVYRRFLSCLLLATFASGSILGEGLHLLESHGTGRVHHCHHHGHCMVVCTKHRHHHHDADVDDHTKEIASNSRPAARAATCGFSLNKLIVDSHACGICAYLLQAVSQTADTSAPFNWQPLVGVGPTSVDLIFSQTALGSQAPRGPPFVA
jgi:hypothetical protein